MGIYVSVRGWLQCDREQLDAIKAITSSRQDGNRYADGWCQPQPFSWTSYVFYGGDIREQAVDWLLNQLQEIARIPASDEDNDRVRGLFLASHEVNGMSEWQIRDGQLIIAPADDRYHYLDA